MNKHQLIEYWSDWLVDAVATATQDRQFLRGDEAANEIIIEALLANAKKAIECAIDGVVPNRFIDP